MTITHFYSSPSGRVVNLSVFLFLFVTLLPVEMLNYYFYEGLLPVELMVFLSTASCIVKLLQFTTILAVELLII